VSEIARDRSLTFSAEVKLPGVATLDFKLASGQSGGTTRLTMTARFRPRGIAGIRYWYLVLALHNLVFGGMLKGIKRAAGAQGSRDRAGNEVQPDLGHDRPWSSATSDLPG